MSEGVHFITFFPKEQKEQIMVLSSQLFLKPIMLLSKFRLCHEKQYKRKEPRHFRLLSNQDVSSFQNIAKLLISSTGQKHSLLFFFSPFQISSLTLALCTLTKLIITNWSQTCIYSQAQLGSQNSSALLSYLP